MENENTEVVAINRKKKSLVLISVCIIVAMSTIMFFSNYVSKDKIRIERKNIVWDVPDFTGGFHIDGSKISTIGGLLVENGSKFAVDLEIKGNFYDRENNWLGEHIYKVTMAPHIKATIETLFVIAGKQWATQIARAEYTLLKFKKSKQKMIDVGYSNKNDITVNMNTANNKGTFKNNTNHEINGDFRLKEIYYLKDGSVLEHDIFKTTELVPANKRISFDIHEYNAEGYKRMKEMSEKTETFLYAYEEEK